MTLPSVFRSFAGASILVVLGSVGPALADCVTSGSVTTCNGYVPEGMNFGTVSGRTVSVQPGATLGSGLDTDALRITNSSGVSAAAITNSGTINGSITMLSVGSGLDSLTNNGLITFTSPSSVVSTSGISMAGANFIQGASGTLAFRVDSAGFFDNLLAYRATLGGTFRALVQPGLYERTTSYTGLVSTTVGTTGTFASVQSSSPFFTASMAYVGGGADLTLTRVPFNQVAGSSGNARAVGNVLEAGYSTSLTGTAATTYGLLLASTAPNTLAQLVGEVSTTAQTASFAMFGQFLGLAFGQTGSARSGGQTSENGGKRQSMEVADACLGDDCEAKARTGMRWSTWVQGFGGQSTSKGDATTGSSAVNMATSGGAAGIDVQLSPEWLVGLSAGATSASYTLDGTPSSGSGRATVFGLYGGFQTGPAYVDATLGYGRGSFTTQRTINTGTIAEQISGNFEGHLYGGRVEGGWRFDVGGFAVTPFAGIGVQAFSQDGYTESSRDLLNGGSGALALTVRGQTTTSVRSALGSQFAHSFALDDRTTVTPRLRIGWAHEFNTERNMTAAFSTLGAGQTFTVSGARAASDALLLTTGVDVDIGGAVRLYAKFDGDFSGQAETWSATGGIRLFW